MNRLDFFKKIGKGAVVVVAAPVVWMMPKARAKIGSLVLPEVAAPCFGVFSHGRYIRNTSKAARDYYCKNKFEGHENDKCYLNCNGLAGIDPRPCPHYVDSKRSGDEKEKLS